MERRVNLIDPVITFDEDHHHGKQDTLIIKSEQFIPDEFVQANLRDKIDTLHTPMGDFYRVASIPTGTVDKWAKEGFHLHEASAHDIVERLRKEQLDAFITTRKRI